MSIPRVDPKFTKSDLQKSAKKLVKCAYEYWKDAHKAGISGAVVWVKTGDGCVVFTRGEYLNQIMENIEQPGPVIEFGVSDK